MITEFKIFEKKIMNNAEIGDYVICHITENDPEQQGYTDEFLDNNIGILERIDDSYETQGWYVKFDDVPSKDRLWVDNELCKSFDFNTKIAAFFDDEIKYWSKSKEDLELIIQAKKYNL
jgi:hypothetical protein